MIKMTILAKICNFFCKPFQDLVFQTLTLQCLRKEVEEEVYKSLVNKRLAAGEVTLRFNRDLATMIMICIDYDDNQKHLCVVPWLTHALMTYFDL